AKRRQCLSKTSPKRRFADDVGFAWPGVRRIFREWAELLPKEARLLATDLGETGRRPVVERVIEVVEETAERIASF
ncbi:MAG: hypothetical protein AAFY88_29035, partial [Acidobacteriota bacterium]